MACVLLRIILTERDREFSRPVQNLFRCHAVVTVGRYEMVCAERDTATWYLPAESTDVRDVCGAGDVLAAINAGMLAGNSIRQACRFALGAAGQQVARVGISAVTACGRTNLT